MNRVIPLLGLVLAVGILLPATRQRILDLADPVIRPVLDPFRGFSAKGEMERLVQALAEQQELNRELPTPREFPRWVRANLPQGGGDTDPWGAEYSLRVWEDSLAVISAGPDSQRGTADDVRVSSRRRGR